MGSSTYLPQLAARICESCQFGTPSPTHDVPRESAGCKQALETMKVTTVRRNLDCLLVGGAKTTASVWFNGQSEKRRDWANGRCTDYYWDKRSWDVGRYLSSSLSTYNARLRDLESAGLASHPPRLPTPCSFFASLG
jgi:hypothetical protein